MNAYPFSVFKRANQSYYSVSFKDSNGKFLSPVSTKKRTEAEALQIAFQWLRDGIPQKQAAAQYWEPLHRERMKRSKLPLILRKQITLRVNI